MLLLPAVVVAGATLLPISYLIVRAFGAGHAIIDMIARPRTIAVLLNTALLAGSVTLSAIAIALPLAWLLARTDFPAKRLWTTILAVPLAIPSLIGAYAFVAAFGAGGIVEQWLRHVFGGQVWLNAHGFWGAWVVLTLLCYPYVLLPVIAALRSLDPGQEEAARSLGHSPTSLFFRVIAPNLWPALVSSGLLVALYALSDFAAVSILQFDSFTRAIYVQYQASFNRNYAAVLALLLVGLTTAILIAESVVRGKRSYHRAGAGSGRKPTMVRLGKWRWPALAACACLALMAVGLPVGVVVYWLVRGLAQGESIYLPWNAVGNSVGVALAGAVVTVAAAIPIAVLSARHRSRFTVFLERAAYAGYALPGIVVALSLVFFGARYGGRLYQSIWMLLFAYVILFLPQALTSLASTLRHVGPNVENVARSLGYTPMRVLFKVTLPLAWAGARAGGALVFLTVIKELPATLLLSPIGFRTLVTDVWTSVSEAYFTRAAAPSLLLIGVSSLSLFYLLRDASR